MAAENFKVKKGLEVGTAITATGSGIDVTGIITATQFKGDGSGLTGVVGSGSGVVVKDEGSAVGTAGTINFVGSGVAATLSAGTATVTINAGGLNNVVEDTTPQLGGNLDLNSKFVTGSGNIDITGSLDVSGIATVGTLKGAIQATTASFSGAIDANGDLDVDGQTNLDDVRISGVTTMTGALQGTTGTFSGNVSGNQGTFSGNITGPLLSISPGSGDDGIILLNSAGGQNNDFSRIRQVVSDDSFRIENKSSGSYESLLTGIGGAEVKLYFAGNQKLTTTINGIEVPDLNVTGVGTVGRLDTSGVTLGTNSTTFAAKFANNAVANFGTNNDLQITHGGSTSDITNATSNLNIRNNANSAAINFIHENDMMLAANSDGSVDLYHDATKRFETTGVGASCVGIMSATSFSGSAAGLTSIPSAQLTGALPSLDGSALTGITASGTGIIIQHDGSNVGTAGTINFSTNLDVTPIHAGIVTVTASGGGGGNASTFTVTANNATDETVYPIFVDGATGSQGAETDTGLNYNPSTGRLTAVSYAGDGSALTGISAGVTVQDEGSALSTAGTTLNFVGSGVVASGSGATKTITIAGGGGSGNAGFSTAGGSFTVNAGVTTVINTFNINTNTKLSEYTVHLENVNGNIQSQKVLVMNYGAGIGLTAYSSEYGIMFHPNQIADIGVVVTAGICSLTATTKSGITGITTFSLTRQDQS